MRFLKVGIGLVSCFIKTVTDKPVKCFPPVQVFAGLGVAIGPHSLKLREMVSRYVIAK